MDDFADSYLLFVTDQLSQEASKIIEHIRNLWRFVSNQTQRPYQEDMKSVAPSMNTTDKWRFPEKENRMNGGDDLLNRRNVARKIVTFTAKIPFFWFYYMETVLVKGTNSVWTTCVRKNTSS